MRAKGFTTLLRILLIQIFLIKVEAAKPAQSRLFRILDSIKTSNAVDGSLDFSVAGLFRCMFCTHPKSNAEQMQLIQIADQLTELDNKLKQLEL